MSLLGFSLGSSLLVKHGNSSLVQLVVVKQRRNDALNIYSQQCPPAARTLHYLA